MTVNDLKAKLRIATLAVGVGLAVLLVGKKVEWIRDFDYACVMAATSYHAKQQHLLRDIDSEAGALTIRSVTKEPAVGRSLQTIQITDDPDRVFEHCPPSALDYAVILQCLYDRGFRQVVISTRMSWDGQPGLEAEGLGSRLALFDRAVIPVSVTRAATPEDPPPALQRALIPYFQVRGNHHLLPMVNRVPVKAHTDGGENTLAGFHHIENAPPSPDAIPMLARWQDHGLIPSIELLAIMAAHDVSSAELIVHCGRHIRLGVNGPVIPIDAFGQTPLPAEANAKKTTPAITAEQLVVPDQKSEVSQDAQALERIALIHATGRKTSATNTLPHNRLAMLPIMTRAYPLPANPRQIPRVPWWASVILIIDLALLSCWFGEFHRTKRHLAHLLSLGLLWAVMLGLVGLTNHWLGLSAPLATLVSSWVITARHNKRPRKQTDPIQQYDPSSDPPVMRP